MPAANDFSVLLVGPPRPFLQELRTSLLQAGDMEIDWALDPQSALVRAAKVKPNIVLVDHRWELLDPAFFCDVLQALVPTVYVLDLEGGILRRPEAAGSIEMLHSVVTVMEKAAG
jgi:PleD family two-component response regulator